MESRRSRFIRMGSKIGAGAIVGAVLAVVPVSPAGATHLTSITLSSAIVPQGTANVVLNGLVDNQTDSPGCEYGWTLSTANGTLAGNTSYPGGTSTHVTLPYTLTVNTGALAPGVYAVSVKSTWISTPACNNDGPKTANATIKITGRNGAFQCRAYAARTQTDYQPSNPSYNPCKDDANWFGQLQPIAGLGNIGVVRTFTDQQPNVLSSAPANANDYADAHAHVAGVDLTVAGTRIRTGAIWARSAVNCQGLGMTPKRNSDGTAVGVQIAGRSFGTTTDYLKVVIGALKVELNKTTNTANSTQRQGVVITYTTLFTVRKWVIAETKAGWTGNPCQGVS